MINPKPKLKSVQDIKENKSYSKRSFSKRFNKKRRLRSNSK